MSQCAPVGLGEHVVADGQELHDPLVQVEILQPLEQIRVPGCKTNLSVRLVVRIHGVGNDALTSGHQSPRRRFSWVWSLSAVCVPRSRLNRWSRSAATDREQQGIKGCKRRTTASQHEATAGLCTYLAPEVRLPRHVDAGAFDLVQSRADVIHLQRVCRAFQRPGLQGLKNLKQSRHMNDDPAH